MTSWIALVLSIISVVVSIVAQYDKLKQGFNAFKTWRKDKNELKLLSKKVRKTIRSAPRTKEQIFFRNFLVSFNFLISIVSSTILSLVADLTKPIGLTLFVITLAIYVLSSAIPVIAFLISIDSFNSKSFRLIFVITFLPGITWSFLTCLFSGAFIGTTDGLPLLLAGIVAAVSNYPIDKVATLSY